MAEWILASERTVQERRGKIRTFTGKYVNPLDLQIEDIDILDLAHHLSIEPRYSGATKEGYSVCQHSLIVASYFRASSWDLRLASLMHDSPEFVLKDLSSPVKASEDLGGVYKKYETKAAGVIFSAFGLMPYETAYHRQVKVIDDIVFDRERRSFFGQRISPELRIRPLPAKVVERAFLQEFRSIVLQQRAECEVVNDAPAFKLPRGL